MVPSHIDIKTYMGGLMKWKYVDQPFPELAEYDQMSLGDYKGNPLGGVSLSRMLIGNETLNLGKFSISNNPTLEFWVSFNLSIRFILLILMKMENII